MAIRSVLGRMVRHRTSAYLNNRLEQDHCGIMGRTRCMRGFKSHITADRFCREHGELCNLLRPRRRHNQIGTASSCRVRFARGARIALDIMTSARTISILSLNAVPLTRDLTEPTATGRRIRARAPKDEDGHRTTRAPSIMSAATAARVCSGVSMPIMMFGRVGCAHVTRSQGKGSAA